MIIRFDERRTSPRELKRVIDATGFKAIRRRGDTIAISQAPTHLPPAPDGSPAFLGTALQRAREQGRAVVLDFHAPWCAPCRRLESVTFADAEVSKALASVEFIKINLDEHPGLAAAYGVASVPHVILARADGRIVSRLVAHEGPAAFLRRLADLRE